MSMLSPRRARGKRFSRARSLSGHLSFEDRRPPLTEPRRRSSVWVRPRRGSATRTLVLLAVGWVLFALAGCGQAHDKHRAAVGPHTNSTKAEFILAADEICTRHLGTALAWLGKRPTGSVWQQRAIQDEGIYRIIAATITRLQGLGSPPGPMADAFTGYVKTLKARAVLYRLISIADQRHDPSSAARLQQRVVQIDLIGDRDADRYGLRICGSGPRDIAPPVQKPGSIQD